MDSIVLNERSEAAFATPDDRGDFRQRHHWWMLGLAGAIVILSFLLEIQRGDRVALRGLSDYPFPHVCTARQFWEAGCPGCGLTRSFIALAAGDFERSLAMHRLGWLVALAVAFQIPYRIAALSRGRPPFLIPRIGRWFGVLLVLALIADWLLGPVLGII